MKKVIIIGASSGIGRGLAELFAKKGFKVGATGRRSDLLASLQNSFPNNIIISCFDITADDSLLHIDSLINQVGGIDIFIYCAGIGELTLQPVWTADEKMIRTNVTAFAKSTGHIFNYFVQKGSGHIVIISSIASIRGGTSAPAYNASKAFQSNFAESLNLQAINLGKEIVVTDIKPGFVDTDMAKGEGKFWVMPVDKVCRQIEKAISLKKRKVVVTKRWILPAFIMKWIPDFIFIYLSKKIAGKRQPENS